MVQNLFVKVVPDHLRGLVKRHKLFERELVLYRLVRASLGDQFCKTFFGNR